MTQEIRAVEIRILPFFFLGSKCLESKGLKRWVQTNWFLGCPGRPARARPSLLPPCRGPTTVLLSSFCSMLFYFAECRQTDLYLKQMRDTTTWINLRKKCFLFVSVLLTWIVLWHRNRSLCKSSLVSCEWFPEAVLARGCWISLITSVPTDEKFIQPDSLTMFLSG